MNDKIRDLVIIGAGPSALTAAIYTSREDIDTTVYEKMTVGGLVAVIDKVDNFPGFCDGVEGPLLVERLEKQAKRFGAHIEYGEVTKIEDKKDYKVVTVDDKKVKTKAVLIATGRDYKKIGVPGEDEYFGKGVHYCAICDGAFYRNKDIAVVGGANSAVQETIYLTRFASHIDLIVKNEITATKILQHELQKYIDNGKVSVHLEVSIDEIVANDGHVTSIKAHKDGKQISFNVTGVFVFVGMLPNTNFLKGSDIKLSEDGFVITDKNYHTSMQGVFASGDVRDGAVRQIASAAGDGVIAATSIRNYLNDQK